MIFVFGSNLAGRHGKGAALEARLKHGATYGVGRGRQGNSYGIPTKDYHIRTLPIDDIRKNVTEFLIYARTHAHLQFQVTPVGCGLAGYNPWDIAPMFNGAPDNVHLPEEFKLWVNQ